MRPHRLRQRSSLAIAGATIGVIMFGCASLGFSAALVGETRHVAVEQKAAPGADALKKLYRRPAAIPFPKDNPYTPEKAALGKKLYFDTRLSVTSAQSCGSCHSPSFGWGDGLAVGVGHGMQKLGRHTPTVVNAAWSDIFMWDGRLPTLEDQALGPIQSTGEMNMPLDELMARLKTVPE
ncbi:MAG: cytochrome-c peroxidase, partial [Bradyrhizobium sp.]|nr:cytochrome-c peroxidase [Bradyrhizobium sp.]